MSRRSSRIQWNGREKAERERAERERVARAARDIPPTTPSPKKREYPKEPAAPRKEHKRRTTTESRPLPFRIGEGPLPTLAVATPAAVAASPATESATPPRFDLLKLLEETRMTQARVVALVQELPAELRSRYIEFCVAPVTQTPPASDVADDKSSPLPPDDVSDVMPPLEPVPSAQ